MFCIKNSPFHLLKKVVTCKVIGTYTQSSRRNRIYHVLETITYRTHDVLIAAPVQHNMP